jgi:hypothetical protein
LGEPEGREDEVRTESGALPEGARVDEGSAADPAQRERVPPLPGRRQSAGDMSLDLAAAADEPEQLVRYLIMAVQEHIGYSENSSKWMVILTHLALANEELEIRNRPSRDR